MVAPGEHAADEMTEFGGILLPESERQAIYQNALAGGLSDYEAREKAWPSVSPDAERSEPSAFSGESGRTERAVNEAAVVLAGELGHTLAGIGVGYARAAPNTLSMTRKVIDAYLAALAGHTPRGGRNG